MADNILYGKNALADLSGKTNNNGIYAAQKLGSITGFIKDEEPYYGTLAIINEGNNSRYTIY